MRTLPFLLALTGCSATAVGTPSLLPRAIEMRSDAEPSRIASAVATDPALDADIARLGGALDQALATFAAAATRAGPLLSRSGATREGSDAWIEAQAAIGDVGQFYSAADAAMADLETLAVARGLEGKPPYPALDARLAAAERELTAAEARLSAMKAALS